MRLQKAAVLLFINHGQLHLLRGNPKMEPRSHFRERECWIAAEKQLRDDLLHPSGAGLGVGGNHNVVITKLEIVPNGGVEVMAVKLASLLGCDHGLQFKGRDSIDGACNFTHEVNE